MLTEIVKASGKFADFEPVCDALKSNWLECVETGVDGSCGERDDEISRASCVSYASLA